MSEDTKEYLPEKELDWKDGDSPRVGMGATYYIPGFGMDRHPCTVVKVSNSWREVWVADDDYERVDDYGMSDSQQYRYLKSRDHANETSWRVFTLRQNGQYVAEGEPMRGGRQLTLGVRNRWFNYSF